MIKKLLPDWLVLLVTVSALLTSALIQEWSGVFGWLMVLVLMRGRYWREDNPQ